MPSGLLGCPVVRDVISQVRGSDWRTADGLFRSDRSAVLTGADVHRYYIKDQLSLRAVISAAPKKSAAISGLLPGT